MRLRILPVHGRSFSAVTRSAHRLHLPHHVSGFSPLHTFPAPLPHYTHCPSAAHRFLPACTRSHYYRRYTYTHHTAPHRTATPLYLPTAFITFFVVLYLVFVRFTRYTFVYTQLHTLRLPPRWFAHYRLDTTRLLRSHGSCTHMRCRWILPADTVGLRTALLGSPFVTDSPLPVRYVPHIPCRFVTCLPPPSPRCPTCLRSTLLGLRLHYYHRSVVHVQSGVYPAFIRSSREIW